MIQVILWRQTTVRTLAMNTELGKVKNDEFFVGTMEIPSGSHTLIGVRGGPALLAHKADPSLHRIIAPRHNE